MIAKAATLLGYRHINYLNETTYNRMILFFKGYPSKLGSYVEDSSDINFA
jgi:hypothetical protein